MALINFSTFCGSRLQVSSGISWMTVSTLSKHSSTPGTKPHPAGAHFSFGTCTKRRKVRQRILKTSSESFEKFMVLYNV